MTNNTRDALATLSKFSFWSDKSLFCSSKFLFCGAGAVWDFHWNQSKLSDKNLNLQIMTWPGQELVICIYNFGGFSMSDNSQVFAKEKKWAFSADNLGWKVQFLPWKSLDIYAPVDMRKKWFEKFLVYRVAFWPLRAGNIYWKLFLCEKFILNCKTLHILKSFSMTEETF